MEKLNKTITTYFVFAFVLSFGFPAGVLGIVFGAVNSIVALLVIGIVFAVVGFYVMPILWIKYGEKRRDRSLLYMIENEHIYTIKELAEQMGDKEEHTREKVKTFIRTQILVGYLLRDDMLVLNSNEKQTAKERASKKCASCGANAYFNGRKYICDYCGSVFTDE